MALIPMVIEREGNKERSFDLLSKMLNDRIVFLQGEVRDDMANLIVSQLLYLEAEDPKSPITLYINSPGGSVTAGACDGASVAGSIGDVATGSVGVCSGTLV